MLHAPDASAPEIDAVRVVPAKGEFAETGAIGQHASYHVSYEVCGVKCHTGSLPPAFVLSSVVTGEKRSNEEGGDDGCYYQFSCHADDEVFHDASLPPAFVLSSVVQSLLNFEKMRCAHQRRSVPIQAAG